MAEYNYDKFLEAYNNGARDFSRATIDLSCDLSFQNSISISGCNFTGAKFVKNCRYWVEFFSDSCDFRGVNVDFFLRAEQSVEIRNAIVSLDQCGTVKEIQKRIGHNYCFTIDPEKVSEAVNVDVLLDSSYSIRKYQVSVELYRWLMDNKRFDRSLSVLISSQEDLISVLSFKGVYKDWFYLGNAVIARDVEISSEMHTSLLEKFTKRLYVEFSSKNELTIPLKVACDLLRGISRPDRPYEHCELFVGLDEGADAGVFLGFLDEYAEFKPGPYGQLLSLYLESSMCGAINLIERMIFELAGKEGSFAPVNDYLGNLVGCMIYDDDEALGRSTLYQAILIYIQHQSHLDLDNYELYKDICVAALRCSSTLAMIDFNGESYVSVDSLAKCSIEGFDPVSFQAGRYIRYMLSFEVGAYAYAYPRLEEFLDSDFFKGGPLPFEGGEEITQEKVDELKTDEAADKLIRDVGLKKFGRFISSDYNIRTCPDDDVRETSLILAMAILSSRCLVSLNESTECVRNFHLNLSRFGDFETLDAFIRLHNRYLQSFNDDRCDFALVVERKSQVYIFDYTSLDHIFNLHQVLFKLSAYDEESYLLCADGYVVSGLILNYDTNPFIKEAVRIVYQFRNELYVDNPVLIRELVATAFSLRAQLSKVGGVLSQEFNGSTYWRVSALREACVEGSLVGATVVEVRRCLVSMGLPSLPGSVVPASSPAVSFFRAPDREDDSGIEMVDLSKLRRDSVGA